MTSTRLRHTNRYVFIATLALITAALPMLARHGLRLADAQERPGFVGGVEDDATSNADQPKAVRNDVAQPGEEIVTLRYFKIKKGVFPEFYQASEQGVWPYFEKIGSRVVGMWQIIHPAEGGSEESPDYDEVYLMTRYASVAHWEATRSTKALGGNGPDWDRCMAALAHRRTLTMETNVQFLKGNKWDNAPWFLPALDETYERVEQ